MRIWCVIFVAVMACSQQQSGRLTIAAASSTQYALTELVQEFEKEENIKCDLVFGSSGKLTAQIIAGAPYDVFVSAHPKYPAGLHEQGLTRGTPREYASGKLVLWTFDDRLDTDVSKLTNEEFKHIAIANPKTAPYGLAAKQVLENLGLTDSLEAKLVYGESVSQVNQFITKKSADIGFTSKSIVLSNDWVSKGQWTELDTALYEPIVHSAVVMQRNPEMKQTAEQFVDFLFSSRAKEILANFGYTVSRK